MGLQQVAARADEQRVCCHPRLLSAAPASLLASVLPVSANGGLAGCAPRID
ncbi:hypothetical protein ENSA5_59480 [Enhygromyxa salina]|uniref:Uncharacterized protein n=1 Tax=Enhygromyxa salina TaxID=215803 RepID=A0A2S9XDU8_9BACT|nr:hypothetical protein ENSA5_59480 [Enhygromyxa salina]